MIRAFLYVYPHPHEPGKFLYVGQERTKGKRDKRHRRGTESFGRRFRMQFPGVELPQPIRREVIVPDFLTLNEEETIDMFRFHTWRGYKGGMNVTLPGSADYKIFGRLGGLIGGHNQPREVKVANGRIGGRISVESGHLDRIRELPQTKIAQRISGQIAGHIVGQKHRENGTGIFAPGMQSKGGLKSGRNNVESGHFASIRSLGGRIGGHISGTKAKEKGLGIFAPGVAAAASSIGGRTAFERGLGVFARTPEQMIEDGRKGGYMTGHITLEKGTGLFGRTPAKRIEDARNAGLISACKRFKIDLGKPCSCGRHLLLEKAA